MTWTDEDTKELEQASVHEVDANWDPSETRIRESVLWKRAAAHIRALEARVAELEADSVPRRELAIALRDRSVSHQRRAGMAPEKTRFRWHFLGSSEALLDAATEIEARTFPPKEGP